ncbi:MAG: hypothetical protein NZ730_06565 [Porticoccaceae bacterium]|nr:hypothetical protein [Porticoccaceae bacterium]
MKSRLDELREQAEKFNSEHPEVWEKFEEFAFDRIKRGYKHFSSVAIIQRIRWDTGAGGDGRNEFKIANAHCPFYGRWFMQKYPEHEGFFRTCVQKSAVMPPIGERQFTPDMVI